MLRRLGLDEAVMKLGEKKDLESGLTRPFGKGRKTLAVGSRVGGKWKHLVMEGKQEK